MKTTSFARIAALAAILSAPALYADVVDLGQADNYAVLGLDSTNVDLSLVTVNGNVGVGPDGKLTLMGPSVINGTAFVDPTATIATSAGTATGGIDHSVSLAGAVSDAISASQTAAALTPTQTLSGISSGLSLVGTGGTTVIDVNGGINLNNQNITLGGAAGSKFVFNITGGLTMVGSASVVLQGGVTGGNVLFNFDGSGESLNTHVGDVVLGTVLAPNANGATLDGKFGQLIVGGPNVTLMSGATVNYTPIPEANTGLALIPFVLGMLLLFSKQFFAAKPLQDEAAFAETRS